MPEGCERSADYGGVLPWVKVDVAVDRDPKVISAGFYGKELFLFLLRLHADVYRAKANGVIGAEYVTPAYIAAFWQNPGGAEQVAEALAACSKAGLIRFADNGDCEIVGWTRDKWGMPKSGAERRGPGANGRGPGANGRRPGANGRRPGVAENKNKSKSKNEITTPELGAASSDVGQVICLPPRPNPDASSLSPPDKRSASGRAALAVARETVRFFNQQCGNHGLVRRSKVATHAKRVQRLLAHGHTPLEIRMVILWALDGPEHWAKDDTKKAWIQLETLLKYQSGHGSRTFREYLERAEEWVATKFGADVLQKRLGTSDEQETESG